LFFFVIQCKIFSKIEIFLENFFSKFRLTTTEEMLSVGLYLHDLNFYDGSSEILIAGMQHARTLQAAIDKQHAWITKLQHSKLELQEWRRKGRRLLYSIMPRHIAQMLQEGVLANSICEVRKKENYY
jgi:guanylate cyclase